VSASGSSRSAGRWGYKSASTMYARRRRPPSRRSLRDAEILGEIRAVRKGFAAVYGARRGWIELRRRGVHVARCTVERIMREHGMVGVRRGKRTRTTTADPAAARAADLVNRNFTAPAPNRLWMADISYSAQLAVMCSSVGGPRPAR